MVHVVQKWLDWCWVCWWFAHDDFDIVVKAEVIVKGNAGRHGVQEIAQEVKEDKIILWIKSGPALVLFSAYLVK